MKVWNRIHNNSHKIVNNPFLNKNKNKIQFIAFKTMVTLLIMAWTIKLIINNQILNLEICLKFNNISVLILNTLTLKKAKF